MAEFEGHRESIYRVAYSPDGKFFATGSGDDTARLWDLRGNLVVEFKGHQSRVKCVVFSPDGQWLATGSWDKTARLWESE